MENNIPTKEDLEARLASARVLLTVLQAKETAELLERLGYTIGNLGTNEDVKKAFTLAADIREVLNNG